MTPLEEYCELYYQFRNEDLKAILVLLLIRIPNRHKKGEEKWIKQKRSKEA